MRNRQQITKKLIDTTVLEDGQLQHEITDLSEPALRVIIYPNKVTWAVRVNWKRKRHYKTLGTFPHIPIPQARQLASQFKRDIQTGEYNEHANIKLRVFVSEYYNDWIVQENKTGQEYVSIVKKLILPVFGEHTLGGITQFDITEFLNARAEGVKPATVNRTLSVFASIYRLAIAKSFINKSKSPVLGIKARAENNIGLKKPPEPEQLTQLKKLCHAEVVHQQSADLILLLLYAGLRLSEALSLQRCNIQNNNQAVVLHDNKSNRPVKLPLNSEAQKVIARRLENTWNDFLFPSPIIDNKPMTAPNNYLRKFKKEVGLEEFGFHHCRAIFCTIAAKSDINAASKLLNHGSRSVTDRYLIHSDHALLSASESVAEYFQSL